jgi:membrane-associated phospholipid phosphatase
MTAGLNRRPIARLFVVSSLLTASVAAQSNESIQPTQQRHPTEDMESVAQDLPRSSDPGKQPFFSTFFRDEWQMWSSPFRAGSYDSHTFKKYVIPFAAITAAMLATDRKATDAMPNSAGQTRWSRRISQVGAPYSLAGMSGATYLLGKVTRDKHAREAGWLGMLAIAHSQILVQVMKPIARRERPDKVDGRGGFFRGGDSFPSGHATSSFALATVMAYEYRDHIAVPITAYSLATAVSLSRMAGRRHWASDIFVGGSMGFLVGRYVYKRHHDPDLPGSPVTVRSRLMPEFNFGGNTVALSWHL